MDKELLKIALEYYKNYPLIPYISPNRNLEKWLKEVKISKSKLVPLKNMIKTKENLLAGDIILLWRINFGTFTTDSIKEGYYPKYFEYSYGINAPKSLEKLLENEYIILNSYKNSLAHNSLVILKNLLKEKGIKGITKLKKEDVYSKIIELFSEEELSLKLETRVYSLTSKGEQALLNNQDIVERHPKKKM